MNEPAIDVALVAWPNHPRRMAYFRRTLAALKKNLSASRHALRWVCSSESQHDPARTWHGEELEAMCREHGIGLHWRIGKAALGANMNAALRLCAAPLIFLVQDDYELLEPLDLSPGADFLLRHGEVDLVRYSYFLDPHSGTRFEGSLDGWRRVDIDGPWPYGDDPHLRRPDFVDKWGWYLEKGRHGVSEYQMLLRLVHGRATIVAADRCYFGHFGEVASVIDEYRPRAVPR